MKNLLISVACVAITSSAVSAHHGTSGQFDSTKIIEISGTITKMAFVNPHAYVYFDAVMPDGSLENWNCELRASSVLRRSGWTKEMFAVGSKIDIVGVAARKDPQGCYVETIAFNGSAPIKRYDKVNEDSFKPLVKQRPAITAWGTPNISGDWAATQRLHGQITAANAEKINPDDLEELIENNETTISGERRRRRGQESFAYTTAGKAFIAAQDVVTDNVTGRLDCTPRDFFSDWTFDQPTNQIIQTEEMVMLKYGFMDTVRTVHLTDEFPDGIEPSWTGYSIGHWDDDTLIVTTKGFEEGGSARRGYHSDAFTVTERFTYDPKTPSLTRSYEARDPKFWSKSDKRQGSDVVYLSEVAWEPYNCDDRSVE